MPDHDEVSAQQLDPAATDLPGESARNGAKKRRDPDEPAAVVGLGASAGGVTPLQQFFGDMDPKSGLAFVVVMHLSPEHESQLANVLQQKTSMPVTQVEEPVHVRPNHVYVIPPNHQLTFEDSTLRLVPPQQAIGRRVTIDLFFRTLAYAYGQRAVSVIMSGTDSDGVIGLKHVRAQGGLTIAQDPSEAEFDSMPASAISTGMIDWVLPVAQMPARLLEFARNENRMKLPPEIPEVDEADAKVEDALGGPTISDETRDAEDEEAIGKVLGDLRVQTGHDFSHYKRATVLRRIARRLQVNSIESIPRYLEFLRSHPAEARALLQDMLIGVTHFFRDRETFAALEAHIPQLFAGKTAEDEVRVWVTGCATGEEAYSIAMLLCEHCERLDNPPKVQIFATDIDEQSIADARDGRYPTAIEADVSPERLRSFFVKDHGRYRVRKEVREKILFAAHNVLRDAPFSRCDLISCRNLLIYLKLDAQQSVFDLFHFALRPGGLLFLGTAENHGEAQTLFSPLDPKHRVYVRRSIPRPIWKLPNLPGRLSERTAPRPMKSAQPALPALSSDAVGNAGSTAVTAIHAGQTRRDALFGELHLRLLEQYGPPSVVVNELHDVVHLSGSAGRFLQFAPGEPTANIAKVVNPALAIELRTALFKATQESISVRSAPTAIEIDGKTQVVTLEVRPMRADEQAEGFFLILFETERPTEAPPSVTVTHDAVVRSSDEEIRFLKQQLANTIEQYEAANEELKASNEELQAMNEEMRSTAEELETSKEELQSVNEELTTVNYELKANVEELSRTNVDLNNLMASTDIGTIFLDRQLRVHRFTPSATKVFNLIPADLGRPISDITSRLHYDGFLQDLELVLQDLRTIEREVRVGDGDPHWYLTRIAPYRSEEDRIAGVVATFVNINARRKAEEALRESHARTVEILESISDAFYTVDADFNFTYVNKKAEELWKRKRETLIGRNLWTEFPAGVTTESYAMHHRALKGKVAVRYEIFSQLVGRWVDVSIYPSPHGGLSVYFRDITARKEAEQALRASEERLRTIADHVPQLIWTNDAQANANYFNRRWYEYSGLTAEESYGRGWEAIVHPDDAASAKEKWRRAVEKGEVFDVEYRLRRKDDAYRWFIGRNVPLRQNGEVLSWFGSATDIDDYKHADARLRVSEERFRVLVEGARDYAMFLLDPENVITFWSKGAERVFGWSQEEALGRKGDLIFTPEDKAKGAVQKEIDIALLEGRAPDRRYHLRKNRSRFWADGVLMRLDDEHGQVRGFAKVARDATDQRRIEDELAHSRDDMEQRVVERTRELLAMNNELERTMQQRQELERELLEISEREKRRIGEDLHDMICQELTATALFLQSSAKKIAKQSPAAAKTLGESAQTVNRNVVIARELAGGLQAIELSASGLKNALRELADRASQNRNIKCHFKCARGVRVPDDAVALHLYRVAQEAVTNAVKHSGARNILISLDHDETHVCVSVQDDGKGFSVEKRRKGKGLGIHMMRYRANALGGEFKIERRKTGGMDVTCKIPSKGHGGTGGGARAVI